MNSFLRHAILVDIFELLLFFFAITKNAATNTLVIAFHYSIYMFPRAGIAKWQRMCIFNLTVCACSVVSVIFDSLDCSTPGSSVHRILQARILEWVAMPSSRRSSWPRDWTRVSCGSCIAGGFFTTEPPGKPCLNHWTTPNWLPMFNLSFNLETSYQYLTSWTLHSYHLLGDSNNQERLEIIGLLKTLALLGTILFWFIILECIPTLI